MINMKWRKFNIVYEEWDSDSPIEDRIIDDEETMKQLKIPCAIKTSDRRVVFVGDINKELGSCGCCSFNNIRNIDYYTNIDVRGLTNG